MFLNLYNICQTIRVIEGIKEIAERREDSPEHSCEDNSFYSSLDGLKSISILSDINSRVIFNIFQSLQTELKDSKTSLEEIKEKNQEELIKSFKEAVEENISGIGPLILFEEYEILVKYLLENHLKEFTKFCGDINNTKFTIEAINEAEHGQTYNGIGLNDLKRLLEVTVEDNQDLIRRLLIIIDPTLDKNNTVEVVEINGTKRQLIKNDLIGEIKIGRKILDTEDSAITERVLETTRNLYYLLPEYNTAEDTAIFENPLNMDTREENIKRILKLSQEEIEKGNLMNAQLFLETAIRNGLRNDDITTLLRFTEKSRKSPEVPGKEVTVDYKAPIPIGNKHLWIARGDDLNKVSNGKEFKDSSFYLVGESISFEIVELPNTKSVLVSNACRNFNSRYIKNSGLTVTINGNQIKLDLSSMSFESATNERLVSAHKALVGSKHRKGLIEENRENHNTNAKLFIRLEDLLETLNTNLTGNNLRRFIYDVIESQNPLFSTLDMHGDAAKAVEEWNIDTAKALKKRTFEICERDRNGNGTTAARKTLKKKDFLEVVNKSDLNDFSTCIVLQSILRWNVEFSKDEQDRECLYSYFEYGADKLRSHSETITGAEDEINIRLQKRMEEHMWKELPNMRFKIDSFSDEKYPVVIKEDDWY